eukprot:scaffold28177_cov55-Phaeocystis_antarctica.AAC.3
MAQLPNWDEGGGKRRNNEGCRRDAESEHAGAHARFTAKDGPSASITSALPATTFTTTVAAST